MFSLVKNVPCVSRDQMIEVDRAMTEEYGIQIIQMMENAGRHLATIARYRFLDNDPTGKKVTVLVGSGRNGGGGLVCARWLYNWGCDVRIFSAKPTEDFTRVTADQLAILQHMGLSICYSDETNLLHGADLIIDSLAGYNLSGPPRDQMADLILWANEHGAPILSLDVPSGLDTTTGELLQPTIRADATLTLALPKCGLIKENALNHTGDLYLADIGVPPALYKEFIGIKIGALFAKNDILRIR